MAPPLVRDHAQWQCVSNYEERNMSVTKKLLGMTALVVGMLFASNAAVAQQDNLIDTI